MPSRRPLALALPFQWDVYVVCNFGRGGYKALAKEVIRTRCRHTDKWLDSRPMRIVGLPEVGHLTAAFLLWKAVEARHGVDQGRQVMLPSFMFSQGDDGVAALVAASRPGDVFHVERQALKEAEATHSFETDLVGVVGPMFGAYRTELGLGRIQLHLPGFATAASTPDQNGPAGQRPIRLRLNVMVVQRLGDRLEAYAHTGEVGIGIRNYTVADGIAMDGPVADLAVLPGGGGQVTGEQGTGYKRGVSLIASFCYRCVVFPA